MQIQCTRCTTANNASNRFCTKCGSSLSDSATLPTAKQPSQQNHGCVRGLGIIVLALLCLAAIGSIFGGSRSGERFAQSRQEEPSAAPSLFPTASETAVPTAEVAVTAHTTVRANFRIGPGTNYNAFRQLDPGTEVKLLGKHTSSQETWYEARVDGRTGWLSATVVEVDPQLAVRLPALDSVAGQQQIDDATRSYAFATALNVGLLTDALEKLALLQKQPDLNSSQWRSSVQEQLLIIRAAHQAQNVYEPVPAHFAALQDALTDATETCSKMTYAFERVLDQQDTQALQETLELSAGCADKLVQAQRIGEDALKLFR